MANKIKAPTSITLRKLLNGIKSKKYYTHAAEAFRSLGYRHMTVDISAAPFNIDQRYEAQKLRISQSKRGNLSVFAGKKISVICTTISNNGPRINFWAKAI